MRIPIIAALLLSGCVAAAGNALPRGGPAAPELQADRPHGSHVTIVLMENKDYDLVVGSSQAPYLNKVLIPQGALLENSHAVAHPSEPNYLALFSGSTQGVTGDPCPVTFDATNIASELIAAGKTFAGYSESLPRDGYTGCYSGRYARKHSPWVDFTNVPPSDNLVYDGFPKKHAASFVWITPNLCHDTHDCVVKVGDKWLAKNLPPIVAWDKTHDGLLILTWDEADPDANGKNQIATVLVGPMVKAGITSTQKIDHYGVLRTIEKILKVPCIANDCKAKAIKGIWQ
ncbi:MAG: acid phosphatase [Candidatus Eremiobacteraeota bacterium]|nr:acid phosphatase [Candidatus Eremiobacteraeota bacterium]